MATADTKLGGSEESMTRSEESMTRSEESMTRSEEAMRRSVGPVDSWESELTSIQNSLKFVLMLKEEYVCPVCRGVVLNPQQNSCGHIYCYHCLQGLLESSSPSSPVCPVEGAVITPAEVFQDKCCKREISCLEVYCTNYPACTSVVTLQRLQEHLSLCQYEQLQCTNPGCRATLQRRHLQDHVTNTCRQRTEPCPHCQQPLQLSLVQDHLHSTCPQVEVDCPNSCSQTLPRHQLAEHREACPEVHADCSYRRFGCLVQDKRRRVKLHEDAAVNHHMLLVLRSNTHLEQQVEVLQEEALLRQQEVQVDGLHLAGLQKKIGPLQQQTSSHEHIVSAAQRTLSRQEDVLSTVQLDIQQVSRGLGSGLEDLEQLKKSVDAVIQKISATEALKEHLETLEENLRLHSSVLELHATQLSCNKQHLQELEATSHDGKLIWKIDGFRKRSEDEAKGQPPCLTSSPFHTGRCGYKMAAKAYLNGDGEGRGTHLSLYVVLMPGDFDALLPWPFKQNVSLSILDQSGAGNHRTLSFRPDLMSKSFQRPDADSFSNVASGLSCFIPLDQLENPQNASYVDDDTLFVKVKVDMAGLEQL
uniref:TNF receptor-associated factor n=1 Tax=Labrus bergylta TaxID=56723 RepID=A0A3Q3GEC6_9LABR|nr:TNF receptor-associated factor 5-like [Labrus bergylta]XP_020514022.1 TNF receptor-associated factor 5-like [Labrus bergylta]XP_020514023.1 TNF receptor-associated factor 5-like [Labrus bergylta]XP_020514024.1 TNF receptor-associated factor 5-like [Labrus bergylta]